MFDKKLSLSVYATVTSKAILAQPKFVRDVDPMTGKKFMKRVCTFDQEHTIEIEFPVWPAPEVHICEGLGSLKAQIAIKAMDHLERARKKIVTTVQIEPVVYEKLPTHEMKTEVNKKYGFQFKYPIEHKEHELEAFFVKIGIPYNANKPHSEIVVHQGVEKILPAVIQELSKKGATV